MSNDPMSGRHGVVLFSTMTTTTAYSVCLQIARSHYENFPVASWLVPAHLRGPIAAIYAFARRADDVADEGQVDISERLESLRALRQRLHSPIMTDAVDVALSDTMNRHALPTHLLERLIDAFVSDVQHQPFTTWQELLAYCSNSADPVGEALLRLDHSPDEPSGESVECSNCVCSALQITNFLQDMAIDRGRGRSYLPDDIPTVVERTYELFNVGRGILNHLRSRRLRWEVALTIAGGVTILDLCADREADNFRPALGLRHVLHVLRRLNHVIKGKPLVPGIRALRDDSNS